VLAVERGDGPRKRQRGAGHAARFGVGPLLHQDAVLHRVLSDEDAPSRHQEAASQNEADAGLVNEGNEKACGRDGADAEDVGEMLADAVLEGHRVAGDLLGQLRGAALRVPGGALGQHLGEQLPPQRQGLAPRSQLDAQEAHDLRDKQHARQAEVPEAHLVHQGVPARVRARRGRREAVVVGHEQGAHGGTDQQEEHWEGVAEQDGKRHGYDDLHLVSECGHAEKAKQ